MRTRPFLSHKRQDRNSVIALKRVLATYGLGGWRDLDDLHLGELNQPGFEHAINDATGGCIWYGTKRVLGSWYVNNVELPAAVARKRREPAYPLVPLFATVSPSQARRALLRATEESGAKLTENDMDIFMDANGYRREREQRIADFRADVARRYVRAAVKWLDEDAYSVAITALTEPTGTQDFTFDWRHLIDPRDRILVPGAADSMRDALVTFRDAVKPTAEFPHVTLDLDVPVPVAALVGYEWRVTSRMKLTVRQRTRSGIVVVDGDGPTTQKWPTMTDTPLAAQNGPTVIAVSTTAEPLTEPARGYAARVGASRTLELHAPGELDAAGIRGLARYVAAVLRNGNAGGDEKHLLLAGPCALGALIGAGANAAGAITAPLWNGSKYADAMVFGD
jgi:hypothetical protein